MNIGDICRVSTRTTVVLPSDRKTFYCRYPSRRCVITVLVDHVRLYHVVSSRLFRMDISSATWLAVTILLAMTSALAMDIGKPFGSGLSAATLPNVEMEIFNHTIGILFVKALRGYRRD